MLRIKVFFGILAIAVAYIDLDDNYYKELLADREKLQKFYACLVDKQPCDTFGQHTKNHMKEALWDGCRECDLTQKHYAHLGMIIIKQDFPELYKAFEAKYDPNGRRTL